MRKIFRKRIALLRASFFASVWVGLGSVVFAQTPPTFPYRTVTYIGADGAVLPGPEGANLRKERTFRDSLSGTVRVYNAAGKLKEFTPYAVMDLVKLGSSITYYDSGQMHTKEDFVGSKRNGEFVVYYPEGKVKRRETYEADVRKTGECYALDGSPMTFYEYVVMPSYKGGGSDRMIQAIHQNIRFPREALEYNHQGRVLVSFRVMETGQVADVKIVKGVSSVLDAAVVATVKRVSGFTPGQQDGHAVAVSFTLPITFKIVEAERPPLYRIERPTLP